MAHWTSRSRSPPANRRRRGRPQERHQSDQRHLRRVGLAVEHRLSGEQPPDRHPVQAARQPPLLVPGLHAVGPSHLVEPPIGADDVSIDPSAGPAPVRAPLDHVLERGVHPDLEAAARLPQRAADPQPARAQGQDAARVG